MATSLCPVGTVICQFLPVNLRLTSLHIPTLYLPNKHSHALCPQARILVRFLRLPVCPQGHFWVDWQSFLSRRQSASATISQHLDGALSSALAAAGVRTKKLGCSDTLGSCFIFPGQAVSRVQKLPHHLLNIGVCRTMFVQENHLIPNNPGTVRVKSPQHYIN